MSEKPISDLQKISLYPLAAGEHYHSLQTTSVPTLLSISHGIEDGVMHNRLRGTFYAGFQRLSSFMPQINRFARLASICGEVLIFAYPDAPTPKIPGVEIVLLEADAPLVQEWFIAFAHPDFTISLLTRQISDDQDDPDHLGFGRGRAYQGVVTYQPDLVLAVRDQLDGVLSRAVAEPVPDVRLPSAAHQTFLRVFTGDLENRNQELASLYNTVTARNTELERLQQTIQTMVSRTAWEDAASPEYEVAKTALRKEQLSVLMADIQGFTALSETLPAEVLIRDLNRYLDLVARAVYQGQGDVDKFLGDGVLAFFPNARIALQTAIRIQKRLKAFNDQQLAARRTVLATRIGLATGPCLVARVGSRARQEVTVIGNTVNLASRLQALTETGWVLIDENTYRACNMPPTTPTVVRIKGKRDLQSVYQVMPEQFSNVVNHLKAL